MAATLLIVAEFLRKKHGPVYRCKEALLDIKEELVPPEGTVKSALERARWPSKKKKVEAALNEISNQKKAFMEALNVEDM